MIPVTKPYLPDKKKYEKYIQEIWSRNWLTNNGPLLDKLESQLKDYFDVPQLLITGNGTIALQMAIKALGLKGEIITTPFSYVATTSSIVWEGAEPVFADIDPNTLNINPDEVESKITNRTTGILATHCFGNPCDIDRISAIAEKHNLKVIYDAAHCFGSKYKGKSVFSYGDVSCASFHATKVFHTVEGGAVFTDNQDVLFRLTKMRNFGHDGFDKFNGVGINGKNSEFHAAMGLCVLEDIELILSKRKKQYLGYQMLFNKMDLLHIEVTENAESNYSYYPVIFPTEKIALKVKSSLESNNVYPRRYFYPSLNKLNYVTYQKTPHAELISKKILCLPMYFELTEDNQLHIANIIKNEM